MSMKKMMIAAMLVLGASAAFAGDSDALKAITKEKDYAKAVELVKSSLGQLANSGEKAKAYEHLTRLALQKFDKENAIQAANMQAQITKQKVEPYDTLGFYQAAYDATQNALECFKYDAEPNERGKVKPRFTESLTPLIANARMQLVTAGNYYAQLNDQDNVLKYWGSFLDSDNLPYFQSTKEQEKQFLGQVAYYTAQYANQAKKYDLAEKYADIATQDTAVAKQAQAFKLAMAQRNLKTKADSVAYVQKLAAMYEKEPDNEMIFGQLSNFYSLMGMTKEFDALVDAKIAKNPNDFTAWALKGQALMNRNSTATNPDWKGCVEAFKKAVSIDQTNPVVYTYLGFSMNAMASAINGDRAQQLALYKESMGYLDKAKELDPNREKANWAYPLYQCYYSVYGANDPKTKELEGMLKQ
uniref:tetratricopeptide repeat protein n=1 Tax=Prevotella sp. TaxID=59823 RepID=UPI004024C51F